MHVWPDPPESFELATDEEKELPPAIWVTDESSVGTYVCTATIYYSATGLYFNIGNQKTFLIRIGHG